MADGRLPIAGRRSDGGTRHSDLEAHARAMRSSHIVRGGISLAVPHSAATALWPDDAPPAAG